MKPSFIGLPSLTLVAVLLGGGCGQRAELTQISLPRKAIRPVSQQHAQPNRVAVAAAAAKPNAAADEASSDGFDFEPPFPNRLDLFRRPDNAGSSPAPRESEPGTTRVTLKGFIDVNGLHALVEIDEMMAALKVGEERAGIQVVEITPPQVILQRGRIRWTERLYPAP